MEPLIKALFNSSLALNCEQIPSHLYEPEAGSLPAASAGALVVAAVALVRNEAWAMGCGAGLPSVFFLPEEQSSRFADLGSHTRGCLGEPWSGDTVKEGIWHGLLLESGFSPVSLLAGLKCSFSAFPLLRTGPRALHLLGRDSTPRYTPAFCF